MQAVIGVLERRQTTIALHVDSLAGLAGIGRKAAHDALVALVDAGVVEKVERKAVGVMVRSTAYAYRLRSTDDAAAQQRG